MGAENDDMRWGNGVAGASDTWLIEENNSSKDVDLNKGPIKRVCRETPNEHFMKLNDSHGYTSRKAVSTVKFITCYINSTITCKVFNYVRMLAKSVLVQRGTSIKSSVKHIVRKF